MPYKEFHTWEMLNPKKQPKWIDTDRKAMLVMNVFMLEPV